jgi:predicted Zn-dependent protease
MRCTRSFSGIFCLITTAYMGCMSATDPGLDLRYNVEFTSPVQIAGKKFSWSQMPVKLRYNRCAVAGCTAAGENAALRGIQFWQKNATLFGEVQTSYAEPPDVDVKYVNSLGGNVIGVCSASLAYNSLSKQYYVLTPISLTIATTVQGQAISERHTEFVAAHEMGHCLGLWDHSPRDGDLMYAYLTSKTAYSARDINSLRWLYSNSSDLPTYPASALADQHALSESGISISSPPLLTP